MGIYSNSLASNATTVNVDAQVYPESMSIMETALTAVIESQENWNDLMKAVGCHELAVLESTGEEIVYEGANLHDFFQAVKAFFVKIIQKLKGIFNQFMSKINSFLMDDKEFIKKYKKDILLGKGKIPSSFSMKGYEFEGVDKFAKKIDTVYGYTVDNNDNTRTKYADQDAKESKLDAIRGALADQDTIYRKDFAKEFKDYLYGDKTTLDDDYVKTNLTKFIADIEGAAEIKKNAKKQLDATVKTINHFINDMEKYERDTSKELDTNKSDKENNAITDKITAAKDHAEVAKSVSEIYTQANGMFLSALKSRSRQSKAICVKLVGYSRKPEPQNASYSFQTEGDVYFQ